VLGADKQHNGKLLDKLHNDYLQGYDGYPKTMGGAYNLLLNWQQDPVRGAVGNDGVSFATNGRNDDSTAMVTTRGGRRANTTCHRCRQQGNYVNECPGVGTTTTGRASSGSTNLTSASNTDQVRVSDNMAARGNAAVMLMNGVADGHFDNSDGFEFIFCQDTDKERIPSTWILLDSQSTIDVFKNRNLLHNLRKAKTTMKIHCTTGSGTTNTVGDLPGYGTV
jgi:hypothetical protein